MNNKEIKKLSSYPKKQNIIFMATVADEAPFPFLVINENPALVFTEARDIELSPPVRPAKAAVGYPTPSTENASNGLQFSALVSPCNVIVGPI